MFKYALAHPLIFAAISSAATFVFNNILSVMVSSLPAPTANSTVKYVYWFKVANGVIGNLQRAKSTRIEDSPNFQPAVDAYIANLAAQKARMQG